MSSAEEVDGSKPLSECDHPEDSFAKFDPFLSWINPLIQLASKRKLKPEDVWWCPSEESIDFQSKAFREIWLKELQVSRENRRNPSFLMAIIKMYQNGIILSGRVLKTNRFVSISLICSCIPLLNTFRHASVIVLTISAGTTFSCWRASRICSNRTRWNPTWCR